ncbi:MAG: BtaA family protein [Saprospiraceae bacterium]
MKYIQHLNDWVFKMVHHNSLVYNTCWEDPRCDRQLMDFKADSHVVMITSAGCNALDYLLDNPQRIECVDMNPRQNALLELKRASFLHGDYKAHFDMFGQGAMEDFEGHYQHHLRRRLPEYARLIWDDQLHYFQGRGTRKSFFYYGSSGMVAWLLKGFLKMKPKVYKSLKQLLAATSMEEQCRLYEEMEPRLISQLVHWVVNRHFTMCMIGVPRSQQLLFKDEYEKGVTGFLKATLRRVFTTLPVSDNYFWQVYFNGHYTPDCAPNYVREQHFDTLQERVDRIVSHTDTLSGFLKKNPGQYSHFILLDHQDWLADNDVPALEEEWRDILANSRPGARILMRSAAEQIEFIPDFVFQQVDFMSQVALAPVHAADRVGSYTGIMLGVVKA